MKKIISIVCILLFLVATSNLAVNIHFCGGEISSIDFFGKSTGCGSCEATDPSINKQSCCKNIATIINTDDTTASGFSFQTEQQSVIVIPVTLKYKSYVPYPFEVLKGSITSNAPPHISAQPYYILYRSLII